LLASKVQKYANLQVAAHYSLVRGKTCKSVYFCTSTPKPVHFYYFF
jgi:hypothetical protein